MLTLKGRTERCSGVLWNLVLCLQASKNKDGDEDVQRKVKEAQKEELEKQNRAQTNSALSSALGGGARWKNWGKKASGCVPTTCLPTSCAASNASYSFMWAFNNVPLLPHCKQIVSM